MKAKIHRYTPDEIKTLRLKAGMSQTEFWGLFNVTQSGGCRYESGRAIPGPVQLLLNFALRPADKAEALIVQVRTGVSGSTPIRRALPKRQPQCFE